MPDIGTGSSTVNFMALISIKWVPGLDQIPTLVPVAALQSLNKPNSQYRSLRPSQRNMTLVGCYVFGAGGERLLPRPN